ncbi:hypothetical protein PR048_030996 [Dryococelus australis]|uniref:Uncharacterized protein n=1 Tax=Dryococelus australis TaxID=614101 RepID=A0ABQ9G410_9NEOP|nr:hypothetical protein PR048_030996 [Dryococelus australis]
MESNNCIKLLNETNSSVWKFQITVILKLRGLFYLVSGKDLKPGIEDGVSQSEVIERVKEWSTKDSKAQEIIVTRLEEGPMTHLLMCESAHEMCVKLLAVHLRTTV